MNSTLENRYERHVVEDDWDITPDGPVPTTMFITVADTNRILKMIYGQSLDPDHEEILSFPPRWGDRNHDVISSWVNWDKLTLAHKAELGITNTEI